MDVLQAAGQSGDSILLRCAIAGIVSNAAQVARWVQLCRQDLQPHGISGRKPASYFRARPASLSDVEAGRWHGWIAPGPPARPPRAHLLAILLPMASKASAHVFGLVPMSETQAIDK